MSGNTEDVSVRLRLKNAVQFKAGVDGAAKSTRKLGSESAYTSRSMRLLDGAAGKSNRAMLALGRQGARLALGGVVALGYELKRSVGAWDQQAAANRRTNAVLQSTHGVSGQTAAGIDRLSGTLARQVGIQDDVIQGGANMLLTFTKVRNEAGRGNDIFNRATSTLVGLSQATGNDMSKSAIQLGKALNDPITGMTALRRVGVTFDDQQKRQITTLVKSGKTMSAQKLILRELNKEFPKTKGTSFERLKVTIDGVEESIGRSLLPTLNRGARTLDRFLQQAQGGVGTGGRFAHALTVVGDDASTAYRKMRPLFRFLDDHQKGVAEVAASFAAISGSLGVISKVKKLTGIGKVAQAAKGLGFGSRGATPKNPLWVAMVNGGGGGTDGLLKRAAKTAAKTGAAAALLEAPATGAIALAPVLPLAGAAALAAHNRRKHGATALGDRNEASRQARSYFGDTGRQPTFDAQGFQTGWTEPARKPAHPIQITVQSVLDGRVIAESVHRHATKAKALK